MEIITNKENETILFAKNYAKKLNPGDILALEGDLGSGKTAFTKGLAKGLGIDDVITSPTFVISKRYPIKKSEKLKSRSYKLEANLVHIDCYRISEDDAEAVGLNEYLASEENITVIEWPENIKLLLPERVKYIKFRNLGNNKREMIL